MATVDVDGRRLLVDSQPVGCLDLKVGDHMVKNIAFLCVQS